MSLSVSTKCLFTNKTQIIKAKAEYGNLMPISWASLLVAALSSQMIRFKMPQKMPQSIPQCPKICQELAVQLFYQTLPLCSYFVVWGVPQYPRNVLSKFSLGHGWCEKFWTLFCIQTYWIFLVVYSFMHPLCKGLWAVRATFLKILNPKSFGGKKGKKNKSTDNFLIKKRVFPRVIRKKKHLQFVI